MTNTTRPQQVKVHTLDKTQASASGTSEYSKRNKSCVYTRDDRIYINYDGHTQTTVDDLFRTLDSHINAVHLYINDRHRLFEHYGQKLMDRIQALFSLRTLTLCGNRIAQLPVGLADLNRLKCLNLSDNSIAELPSVFEQMQLYELDLTRNYLSMQCFAVISQMLSLEELRLGENCLSGEVPDSFSNLKSLKYVSLRDNRITMLPLSVNTMQSLYAIHCQHNDLEMLPFTLAPLIDNNLTFDFSANPLVQKLAAVVDEPLKLKSVIEDSGYRVEYFTHKRGVKIENTAQNDYDYHAVFDEEEDDDDY